MAEYLIQGETLANMADKIRVLNGVEGAMTPAQMDGNLGEVSVEVDEQAELIAQITSALEGKAGGGSNANIETVTITLSSMSPGGVSGTLYYIDKTISLQSLVATAGQVEVLKNTLMLAVNGGDGISANDLPVIHNDIGVCALYQATQDGIIGL